MSEHLIWQTKGGHSVLILYTQKPGERPIVGYFVDEESPDAFDWKRNGRFLDNRDSTLDLIIPEGTVIWSSE